MSCRVFLPLLALCVVAAATGCSKDDDNGRVGTGTVVMRITDAPADIDAVNLVVTEVSVRMDATGDDNANWEVLRAESLSINLLSLQNGVFTELAVGQVPSGHYEQVRLKLGAGSTVTVDGVVHPLRVPSGMQSGLKLVGNFDVPEGGTTVLLLDFDATKSIHQTGNGEWILNPVVRILSQPAAGAIRGVISPSGVETSVYAIANSDTVQRTNAASNGSFLLSVLPAGAYSVAVDPDTGYRDTTITNVVVTAGQTRDLGTVTLTPQ